MNKYLNDVPVFLIFFNRPEVFEKVFDAVRKARPSKLFLACDGPRKNRLEDDIKKSNQCKKIAENVDWECEVYTNYADENLGCGKRMESGISWAFKYVDRLIIIEDDCVPSQDFFPFCEELLEKYKDDQRICIINAMNHLGVYDKCPYDYFFGPGCCWGWATWKRVWDEMDFNMSFLKHEYEMDCITKLFPYYQNAKRTGKERKAELDKTGKLRSWTYQLGMSTALNNQIAIVPKNNMITNIGITPESTHSATTIKKLPKRVQQYFNMPTYKISFPLKHPKYVIEDRIYHKLVEKKFKYTPFTYLEYFLRDLIYSGPQAINKYITAFKFRRM